MEAEVVAQSGASDVYSESPIVQAKPKLKLLILPRLFI